MTSVCKVSSCPHKDVQQELMHEVARELWFLEGLLVCSSNQLLCSMDLLTYLPSTILRAPFRAALLRTISWDVRNTALAGSA